MEQTGAVDTACYAAYGIFLLYDQSHAMLFVEKHARNALSARLRSCIACAEHHPNSISSL
jgi:hypothetical protein